MTTPSDNVIIGNELYPENHIKEMRWAEKIAECLETHYPGYLWAVNVDIRGGMATIQSLRLSGEWGCYVKMDTIVNDPFLTKIKQYGGEILERYRVTRSAANADQIGSLKRDRLGNILADHT